jgi:hypothetical protein
MVVAPLLVGVAVVCCYILLVHSKKPWRWRYDSYSPLFHPKSTSPSPILVHFQPHKPPPSFQLDPSERYLTYLSHSGFHNQRISLENALTLSWLLNRTLILPPIRLTLSRALRYLEFDKLRRHLLGSTKLGLHHCGMDLEGTVRPRECMDYEDWSLISWKWLVDFDALPLGLRVLEPWGNPETRPWGATVSDAFLSSQLSISSNQTYYLKDTSPYQYRFYDSSSDTQPLKSSYTTRIDIIPTLIQIPHKLLHFGSLFGTTRLRLSIPSNISVRTAVRRQMALPPPHAAGDTSSAGILNQTLSSILTHLGGPHTYLAAHLRLGDGSFTHQSFNNIRLVWYNLIVLGLGFSVEEAEDLEGIVMGWAKGEKEGLPAGFGRVDKMAMRVPHPPLPPLLQNGNHTFPCRDTFSPLNSLPITNQTVSQDPRLQTPIYIASDTPPPPLFLNTFPCLSTLSSLPPHFLPSLINADESTTTSSSEALNDFVKTWIDGKVVSLGWKVFGTPGSTFSRFVEDVGWRVGWGEEWGIVERA